MKPRPSHFVLAVLSAFVVSGFASAAERMYDAELERLIASTNRSVVAFRKAARTDFRNSRITWNGTQTAVGNYLEDLEDAGKKLESRYDLNYAAVSEATDFLKRLKGADEFAVANPGVSGAKNEWDVVRTNATALARAYGVDFAADASTWQPARTPDGPIRAEAFSIESQAKTLGKSLDSAAKSAGLDKSRRKVIEGQSETASKAAVDLRRAVDAGRDSAPATQRLTAALADLQATIEKDGLADRVASSWSALQDSIAKLTGFLGP